MDALDIRPLELWEIPEVARLHAAALNRADQPGVPGMLSHYWLANYPGAANRGCWLKGAFGENAMQGIIYYGAPSGARCGQIEQLHVGPRYQGGGVGSALLRHALEELRERGCSSARLDAHGQDRDACGFYEAMGGKPMFGGKAETYEWTLDQ